jgi:DNA modification methylase
VLDARVIQGDSLDVLKAMEAESLDSLVTDPPAGISFMGKDWDDDKGGRQQWVAWMTDVMRECYRVLKPGAHGLVWALPRTSHWTATALEDAGFEVRDVVTHLFGTGFPKSLNLEKATEGVAKGQGTALKPASEHWILVRKPCSEKTVAANVLKWGTGGLNIDGCRVGYQSKEDIDRARGRKGEYDKTGQLSGLETSVTLHPQMFKGETNNQGRFPANLVLDEEAAQALDEQSGVTKSTPQARNNKPSANLSMSGANTGHVSFGYADSGGASRFFYVAKASKSDKGADNTHPTVKSTKLMEYLIKLVTPPGGIVLDPFMGSGSTGVACGGLGFGFVGIERDELFTRIAERRLQVNRAY